MMIKLSTLLDGNSLPSALHLQQTKISSRVVIVTANFITQDWRMCQAVWRSPLLPTMISSASASGLPALGTGARFKHDLLAYFRSYGTGKTASLVNQLRNHDFTSIKAALVASVPSKINLRASDPETEDLWGWPSLKRILRSFPTRSSKSHIVVQISSVASVGEKWLANTFFDALSTSTDSKTRPAFSVIFPTADEIRRSLDGYSAGNSIHMKTQSAAQIKQLDYLRPLLCHWAGDGVNQDNATLSSTAPAREAGRKRAAPHIKTYIRFTDDSMTNIDWAMMTSANLSTQAWGAATNASGEVRICSYEIGVIVWPTLWDEGITNSVEMVPVFKKDTPDFEDGNPNPIAQAADSEYGGIQANDMRAKSSTKTRVGWRMPYDLPLVPYAKDEVPWCATAPCDEPDWMGRSWPGFGSG